jgi:rod shape determining protein RodA
MKGRIDGAFVLAILGLVTLGTLSMLSAASPMPYYTGIVQRHFIALALGAVLFLSAWGFNYQVFQDQSKTIYALVIAMMVSVLVIGSTQRGHKAWFGVGFLTFQPAELARICVILVLANYLDRRARRISEFSTVLWTLAIAGPVIVLILKQPDLGSTLSFFPLIIGMLFCAGADLWHLIAVFGYGFISSIVPILFTYLQVKFPVTQAGSLPFLLMQTSRMGVGTLVAVVLFGALGLAAWRLSIMLRMHAKAVYFVALPAVLSLGLISGIMVNRQLKGYQRNRFVAYVAPQSDIQGSGYNVHQSQIAIGSGGLWGKGLFSGTQSQLGFLPERHTDFIYAVVGEEMGFGGSMSILGLYMLLIWRIIVAARLARDRYGFLVCVGIAALFAFSLFLNVGMCLGLMPVAGIPLPLVSYGGSSLVITLWALGIVANIYARRYSLL